MQRYRLTYISPLGDTYDADPVEADDGQWCRAADVDARATAYGKLHSVAEQFGSATEPMTIPVSVLHSIAKWIREAGDAH